MNMVERVARVLAKNRNARRVQSGDEDIGVMPADLADAIAAIEAMREPADEMFMAAKAHMDSFSSNDSWWKSMIDAALSESTAEEKAA